MAKTKSEGDKVRSDEHLATAVRESAEQIWLAGLGAFAKAQQEGTKVFEALVREGDLLQRRTRAVTEQRIEEVTGRFTEAATQFTRQATQSWDRLEQVFEDRVARALSHLGVPSARDVRELTELLQALNERIAELDALPAAQSRASRAKAARPVAAAAGARKRRAAGTAALPDAAVPTATPGPADSSGRRARKKP